jgi:hypothetical protein
MLSDQVLPFEHPGIAIDSSNLRDQPRLDSPRSLILAPRATILSASSGTGRCRVALFGWGYCPRQQRPL